MFLDVSVSMNNRYKQLGDNRVFVVGKMYGCTLIDIHRHLKWFFEDECLDISTVRMWLRIFKRKKLLMADAPCSGCSQTINKVEILKKKINVKVRKIRRITQRQQTVECDVSASGNEKSVRNGDPKILLNRYFQEGRRFIANSW